MSLHCFVLWISLLFSIHQHNFVNLCTRHATDKLSNRVKLKQRSTFKNKRKQNNKKLTNKVQSPSYVTLCILLRCVTLKFPRSLVTITPLTIIRLNLICNWASSSLYCNVVSCFNLDCVSLSCEMKNRAADENELYMMDSAYVRTRETRLCLACEQALVFEFRTQTLGAAFWLFALARVRVYERRGVCVSCGFAARVPGLVHDSLLAGYLVLFECSKNPSSSCQ